MLIQTKIEVFDKHLSDLAGIEELKSVNMSFRLEDVTAIRETIDDGDSEVNSRKSAIYLKSGESFITYTPYKELCKLLNNTYE